MYHDKLSHRSISVDFSCFDISPESFSVRVTQNDSIFIKQYFSPDTILQLKDSIIYSGILNGDIKEQFDTLIVSIDFNKFNSVYESGHIDGDDYEFFVKSNTLNKMIHVHSLHPPKELTALEKIFLRMRSGIKLTAIDTAIDFHTFSPAIPPHDTASRL